MKAKIIGIVICSLLLIGIIALFICNATGAFAATPEDIPADVYLFNNYADLQILNSIVYNYEYNSTTNYFLMQRKGRQRIVTIELDEEDNPYIQIKMYNDAYAQSTPSPIYTFNLQLTGNVIPSTTGYRETDIKINSLPIPDGGSIAYFETYTSGQLTNEEIENIEKFLKTEKYFIRDITYKFNTTTSGSFYCDIFLNLETLDFLNAIIIPIRQYTDI